MSPITNSFCLMYGRKLESLHQVQWPRCGHISFVKWVSWLSFIEYSLCLEHVVITVLGRSSHRGVGRVSAQVESDSPSSLVCIPSLGKAGRPIQIPNGEPPAVAPSWLILPHHVSQCHREISVSWLHSTVCQPSQR